MTGLRVRLSLVIGGAVVVVVVLAAIVTFQITERPRRGLFEESYAQTAQAVALLSQGPGAVAALRAAGLAAAVPPDPARIDREATDLLQAELRRRGSGLSAVILEGEGPGAARRIVLDVGEGHLVQLDFPERPPRPWLALVSYLGFVALGAIAVSLFAAARILGPLRLLERALGSVRADGTLPPLPERGPAELRTAARTLNALSARLKTATESRMRLIAAAGHDLRTPMTRLRLRAEFLPDAERVAWLRDLAELDAIADSAIRLVREESLPGSFEPVSLDRFLGEMVEDLRAAGHAVDLGKAEPLLLEAQPLALGRALRNMIENAVLHGGGRATVSLEREGETAVLRVLDRGPGIPPALLGRVFEPFFRVDPARGRTVPGAGLGLAIAHEIVARHGGAIHIANRPEGGLLQELRLPLGRAGGSSEAEPASGSL